MLKNKIGLIIIVAIASVVVIGFIFQNVNLFPLSKTKAPTYNTAPASSVSLSGSSTSKEDISVQIRSLNNLLNEYNNYNNAAKQMNTNNNPL